MIGVIKAHNKFACLVKAIAAHVGFTFYKLQSLAQFKA
ncbi:hypothetical protein PTRA_a0012 [Pseudoalteromonas translucida KMM 520]|uniref:Uncharacterized protein n=1 Tax=Pseudoalteromonas translucida KMM 520 TaxID=1315283 RepID=A0A0U2WSU6_9GAMM|nr:hypothetical protein PTRA_a0012 [Pseudoalteromonas translucida KMM 520]